MEKRENRLLKFLAIIFNVLPIIVIILIVMFIGRFFYQMKRQADDGKKWCESVIKGYEADREKFLKAHSDKLRNGKIALRPGPAYKDAMGLFIVEGNGEFKCTYRDIGIWPHFSEYSSKTREWIRN